MEGYEIDVDKIIAKEFYDWIMSTYPNIVFSCLLTQIYLDEGVPLIQKIDHFLTVYQNHGFRANLRFLKAKVGSLLHQVDFKPVGRWKLILRGLRTIEILLQRLLNLSNRPPLIL